jgi:hypothetical protein
MKVYKTKQAAIALFEKLEGLGVISSIENREYVEGDLADDEEVIAVITDHLQAFLNENWPLAAYGDSEVGTVITPEKPQRSMSLPKTKRAISAPSAPPVLW